jgi:hypothetical protein
MAFCRSCGLWFQGRPGQQWCDKPKCQTHKRTFQANEKSKQKEDGRYRSYVNNKHNKLNGRFCQTKGCGVPLKGYYWWHCPSCLCAVDDYSMQTGVCL